MLDVCLSVEFNSKESNIALPNKSFGFSSQVQSSFNLKQVNDTHKTHLVTKTQLNSLIPFLSTENIELVFQELSKNSKEIDYSVLVYDLKG
jgi:hypothetical protein